MEPRIYSDLSQTTEDLIQRIILTKCRKSNNMHDKYMQIRIWLDDNSLRDMDNLVNKLLNRGINIENYYFDNIIIRGKKYECSLIDLIIDGLFVCGEYYSFGSSNPTDNDLWNFIKNNIIQYREHIWINQLSYEIKKLIYSVNTYYGESDSEPEEQYSPPEEDNDDSIYEEEVEEDNI